MSLLPTRSIPFGSIPVGSVGGTTPVGLISAPLSPRGVESQVVLSPVESQSLQLESPSLWTLSLVLVGKG